MPWFIILDYWLTAGALMYCCLSVSMASHPYDYLEEKMNLSKMESSDLVWGLVWFVGGPIMILIGIYYAMVEPND